MTNTLFYGDCLDVLRDLVEDRDFPGVDLIYLDPPFNSKRDYSVLFSTPKGHKSDAQITAFEDTWHWGEQAEDEFDQILHQENTRVAEIMRSLRSFLGENDMMAYLVMMANRLLVMHTVLKETGSLYLHCDPTASHYLKIVLDGVFGAVNFRTEISWKRSSAHSDAKQGRAQYGNIRDILFYYTKGKDWTWNWQYTPYDEDYIENFYGHVEEDTGRHFTLSDLTAAKPGGDTSYEWKGRKPYAGRYWAYSRENMMAFEKEGRLYYPKGNGPPRYKRYLDEMPGVPLQNDWQDIKPASKSEYLGYRTQKPLALLERIISASSNEGDVVMDPFCGCGTAVHAAQKLNRKWIGIDITHLAIALIEKRLNDAYPGIAYEVHGTPKDMGGARDLARRDKYQFQWWAVSLVGAQPYEGKKRGADSGIDGLIFFTDEKRQSKKLIVSVKAGEHVGVSMIRDLKGVLDREKAQIGAFVTLTPPTKPMIAEAAAAGFYESPHHGKYPRVQILTIEDLLAGHAQLRYPDLSGGQTFKKAKREIARGKQEGLF